MSIEQFILYDSRKHVVFGRVVSGEEIVVEVEELPVDNRHRPLSTVTIEKCGQLVARVKTKGENFNLFLIFRFLFFKFVMRTEVIFNNYWE